MVVMFLAIIMLLLAGAPAQISAETQVESEVDTYAILLWTGEKLGLTGTARGQVDFRSVPTPQVQSRLSLVTRLAQVTPDDGGEPVPVALLEVPRAYIRFRFPVTETYTTRVTAGRDRLAWGIGTLFNAGDLLFGADGSRAADFTTTDDVRDETAWLYAMYFPIGDLTYIEPVLLPALPDLAAVSGTTGVASDPSLSGVRPASDSRAGIRLHTVPAGITLEPSYLFDGGSESHNVALSIQGNLAGADLYTGARLRLDTGMGEDSAEILEERSVLSTGFFYSFNVEPDQNLTGRFETLIQPGGSWEDQGHPHARYAVFLHPEIIFSPARTVTLIGRSIISPIDRSAFVITGYSWNIFSGFRAQTFVGFQAGDDSTVYGWDRPGSFMLSTGFTYLF